MKYLSSFIVSAFICMSTRSQTVKSPIKTSSTDTYLVDFTKHTFPKSGSMMRMTPFIGLHLFQMTGILNLFQVCLNKS